MRLIRWFERRIARTGKPTSPMRPSRPASVLFMDPYLPILSARYATFGFLMLQPSQFVGAFVTGIKAPFEGEEPVGLKVCRRMARWAKGLPTEGAVAKGLPMKGASAG